MLENNGRHHLLLSTTSLFQVGRWKSRSDFLKREVLKRSEGSDPPESEVMNRSCPKVFSYISYIPISGSYINYCWVTILTHRQMERPQVTEKWLNSDFIF